MTVAADIDSAPSNNSVTVTVTRNGVADAQAAPQYTAFSYAVPCPLSVTDTSGASGVTLTRISNFACTVPSVVWFPTAERRSVEEVTSTASNKCASDKSLLGFTLIFVGNNVAGEVSHVLYFGAFGYPLVAVNNTVTYIKTVSVTSESALSNKETVAVVAPSPSKLCTRRDYHHLGGACHNDTTVFDSAAFLQGCGVTDGAVAFGEGLRLSKISVWAGSTNTATHTIIFSIYLDNKSWFSR